LPAAAATLGRASELIDAKAETYLVLPTVPCGPDRAQQFLGTASVTLPPFWAGRRRDIRSASSIALHARP
jgi:hypothetical protein